MATQRERPVLLGVTTRVTCLGTFDDASRSIAAIVCSGARCEYRIVMAIVLCPAIAITVRRSTPAITKRLIHVCRSVCQVTSCNSASLTARSNIFFRLCSRSPVREKLGGLEFCCYKLTRACFRYCLSLASRSVRQKD